jgi:FKBP-type peptidyl-prolyl cis-trans isomerase
MAQGQGSFSSHFKNSAQVVVVHPGDGIHYPRKDQTVSIHYNAYNSDTSTEFDSTFRRNRPLEFKLGADMVIPGLDSGVSNLSVGEVARIVIPPDLAWGERGFPGLVPPDTTVIFDVELLAIRG